MKTKTMFTRLIIASLVTLGIGLFVSVFIWAFHPTPNIRPSESNTQNITTQFMPGNSKVYGISIDSKDNLYLHCYHYTMCFDSNGVYVKSFVYQSATVPYESGQFRILENDSIEIFYRGSKDLVYVCDLNGNVVDKYTRSMEVSMEDQTEVTSSNGEVFRVRNFLFFSRVISSTGKTIYRQSLPAICSYFLVILGGCSAVLFFLVQRKKEGRSFFAT